MPKLLLATNNPGKVREFRDLLAGCGWDIVSPAEMGLDWEVEETGSSFAENATLKATDAARASGLVALADDSGLEVDHLGGRPGIFSARYAGGSMTSSTISEAEQLRLLLGEMDGVPDPERTARFQCVIAIATPGGDVRTASGVFEGRIAHQPRGANGFGYDPIFLLPDRDVTSAELDADEKNAISHRGQAARAACAILQEMATP